MVTLNRYNISFIALLLLHITFLFYLANDFSISYKEALVYFDKTNLVLHTLTNFSTSIFGQNDIALRLPFILFYILSSILLYLLTEDYFKNEADRLISVAIFMILPGVNSAALLVNEAILVVLCTLTYLYVYKKRGKECYALLVLFLFIDNSFAILFLALFFRALAKKDNYLLVISLFLFGISMSMYGFAIGGKPKGYFLDTFSIYATIFSPVLFLYFFYSIYRVGIKHEKDLFWYISATALGMSLLFSLRQKVAIEDFAPFVVIAIPVMMKLFMHSFRVRLSEFRKIHYNFVAISLSVLLLNFLVLIANKSLYIFLENPKKHFAYKHHVAKELANELKANGIHSIKTYDERLQLRLKFYNIRDTTNRIMYSSFVDNAIYTLPIEYIGKNIDTYYIVNKLN